jgi:TnpA family transposase
LNLSALFPTTTGQTPRGDDYPLRFVTTLFAYGCNLGPSEAARSIIGIDRKQLAWINDHHITEQRLDKAITKVINTCNQFKLPKFWGEGKNASADGTKWDVYQQNLFASYHIRYGGYGGIAYYHVSDTYIALFSHFIPCGVYEAIYILDILNKNELDFKPDTIHGDTHAQSFTVFGLSYLLGIKLMPRIRKHNKLIFYKPTEDFSFKEIDELFTEKINWKLISDYLPEMFRIALFIQNGMITPSTILRRFGTHSRKNKLYYAFRELGRAVRTEFLLEFYHDPQLRKTISAATNINEEFNQFTKWVAFANKGVIRENLRHEQSKIIKYNHLLANLIILYNVQEMTRALQQLREEGIELDEETICFLAPFRTEHIRRFGSYTLDWTKKVAPLILYTDFLLKLNP